MASPEFSFQLVFEFFVENGGKVKNKDAVRYFKRYLTDPATKAENRQRFKEYVNALAHTKQEGSDKVLILKTKYLNRQEPPLSPLSISSSSLSSTQNDPRNNVGLPTAPLSSSFQSYGSTTSLNTPPRQPPPYRNPPPVVSPSASLDSISLSSASTLEERPSAPPRRKSNSTEIDGARAKNEHVLSSPEDNKENMEKSGLSVKERTQQFNRLASVEDELSPRIAKSAEKDRSKNWMADDSDMSTLTPLEPKKCQEWYVTASRGDCQELLKLARDEPRLVNKKDPFTAYTVLHWGAKYGNAEIIKIFAGKYNVNVNGKTNGGYTPLHISAQFDHRNIFKLLIEVYKADTNIRDYNGRTAEFYLLSKEQKDNSQVTLRKTKGRKKQSDNDLGFLRIGSLNVRVKKTTEAFSNFLGVGNSGTVNPINSMSDEVQKGWGSADNISKDFTMQAPKGYVFRKKSKRVNDTGLSSTPSTPRAPVKNYSTSSLPLAHHINDSDSDNAAGFDSNWQN